MIDKECYQDKPRLKSLGKKYLTHWMTCNKFILSQSMSVEAWASLSGKPTVKLLSIGVLVQHSNIGRS